MKVKIQPIEPALSYPETGTPVMAAEAWIHGPTKPRHAKRAQEKPEIDVSLENLSNVFEFVEVKPVIKVKNAHDLSKYDLRDVDAFLFDPGDPHIMEMSSVMYALFSTGKPVLPPWDNWGYAWRGKLVTGWAENLGYFSFVPMGYSDIKILLEALRGIKKLRDLNILYIGGIPSHSVNADIDPIRIYKKFGCTITPIRFEDYIDAIKNAEQGKVEKISQQWLKQYNIMDERNKNIHQYTSIYVGLKNLLEENEANALTIDCAFLPSVEYVPCVTASLLIDEDIPFGCEGDTNQLITTALFMGVSGKAALMGNLFENALHKDIEENTIVINHDVIPPSMIKEGVKINFRDFHEKREGSTFYADIKNELVTIGGMNFDSKEMWLSKGKVIWSEDTAHCRISIGIKVEDAKKIAQQALGHHQVTVYGDYVKSIELACKFLKLEERII